MSTLAASDVHPAPHALDGARVRVRGSRQDGAPLPEPLTWAWTCTGGGRAITLPFGRPAVLAGTGAHGFRPGAMFAQLRHENVQRGHDRWRLLVLRAGWPGAAMVAVTAIVPGAEILLHVTGKGRTERALRAFAAARLLGIDPADISPGWVTGLGAALAENLAPPRYTEAQHAAHRAMRAIER